MGIKKLLTVAALLAAGGLTHSAWAQTDVTSTYLTNADFESGTAITGEYLYGYGKDGAPYGLQDVTGWSNVVLAGDDSNPTYPNSGLAGATFAYGSSTALKGNGKNAPSTNPDGGNTGNCLGFFAVWSCGAYYYQDVTLLAGVYEMTTSIYNQSGTQNSTSYVGFIPESGDSCTMPVNTTVGQWVEQSVKFTLATETTGKIVLGYNSTGGGSGANPHIFIDNVKLTYTDLLSGYKADLQAEIDAAKALVIADTEKEALNTAIATAENVLANATTEAELTEAKAALKIAETVAKNGMSTATAAAPVITGLVVNGTFDSNKNGWTATGGFQNNGTASNQQGAFTGNIWENWNSSAKVNKMYQDIKEIPNGTYQLSICAFVNNLADPNESQYVFANAEKTYLTTGEPTAYEVFTVVTNNTLEIGLEQTTATANWMGIDNVVLKYYGEGDVIEEAKNAKPKADWTEALTAATTAINDAKYANVTGAEKTALQTEIDKEEPTTADGYTEATTALTTATSAFINAATSYDAWAAIKATAQSYDLAYASSTKKTALQETYATTPTTAEEAASATATITIALRAYVESNGIAEGVDGAVDYTSSITNASEPTNNDGWTISGSMNNPASGEPWTNSDGANVHSYFDGGSWGATGWTTTMKQDVTIPAGRYLLTAIGRASAEVTFTMSVGEASVNLPNVGNAGNVFDRGWNDTSLEFTTPGKAAQETVTIQVDAATAGLHQWFSVSNFRLVLLEATEILNASEAEYAALQSAIAAAEAKTLGFEADEYAPYNNIAALNTLAAAKAIDPASDNTSEVVIAATTALNEAVWNANATEVSAIDLTKLYDANNKDNSGRLFAPGWDKAGGTDAYNTRLVQGAAGNAGMAAVDGELALFTKFGTNYGKEYGYTMPLKANTTYKLTFKFGAWGENKEIVSRFTVTDANDNTVEITPSSFTRTNNSGLANEDVNAWFDYVGVFTTGEAGDYVLTMTKDNNGQQRQIVMGNISLVKAPEATATMSISAAKYGTFIAPFDVEIPDGVTATKITGVDVNGVTLTEEAVEGTIPANTPVLLYSETEVNEEFTAQSLATQDTYTVGLLTGNLSGETINAPMDSYILLNGANGVGFYRVVTGDVTVNNNRVYLTVPAAQAKAFFSFGGGATGINGIEGAEGATEVVRFNAAGVQVAAPVKGLNIVKMSDGTVKKVMVK